MNLILKTGLFLTCIGLSACASAPVSNQKLSRDLFYSLQSSDASEIQCSQKLNDISTSLIGRVLLDPSLTQVHLEIKKIHLAPEVNVESQSKEIRSGGYITQRPSQERILSALLAAHIRYYSHVAHNYLPLFYVQNPLSFAKGAAFEKTGDEFITRYQDTDRTSIELRVQKDGQYIKILTSPFKGNTDMVLRYGAFEKFNILQAIELTCLTPECKGGELSTTKLDYEMIEGLPLIKKIAFNIGDGERKEGTASVFTNIKCEVTR